VNAIRDQSIEFSADDKLLRSQPEGGSEEEEDKEMEKKEVKEEEKKEKA